MNDLSVANNTKFLRKERKTGCTRILSGRGVIFTGCEPKPAPTKFAKSALYSVRCFSACNKNKHPFKPSKLFTQNKATYQLSIE